MAQANILPQPFSSPDMAGLRNGYSNIPVQPVFPETERLLPRNNQSGMTRGTRQMFGSDRVYADGADQQIVVEDEFNDRVLMGNQKTFGEGFYVSKVAKNVKEVTNPADLIFNSNQNVLKIGQIGTLQLPGLVLPGNQITISTQVQASHNLGIVPVCLAYRSPIAFPNLFYGFESDFNYIRSTFTIVSDGFGGLTSAMDGLIYETFQLTVTNSVIFFTRNLIATNGGTGTPTSVQPVNIKFYLLQESIV